MRSNKRGMGIGDLQTIGISFVVIAIILGLGASILGDIRSTQCAVYNSTTGDCSVNAGSTIASNLSTYGLTSLGTLGKWLPTIALVAVVAIIVGLVMVYLAKQYG